MPAYLIARIEVTDPEQYREYMKLSPAAIAAAGGKFLARGGEKITLEGPEETRRVVIVEFPDLATATSFYDSEAYAAARAARDGAAEAQFVVVAGI
ncbi:MAG: DUF1330 domain-containing protein [Gemmatimonadales bacterium]